MKRIAYVEVGDLGPKQSQARVDEFRKMLETESPSLAKEVVMYASMKNGLPSMRIESLPEE